MLRISKYLKLRQNWSAAGVMRMAPLEQELSRCDDHLLADVGLRRDGSGHLASLLQDVGSPDTAAQRKPAPGDRLHIDRVLMAILAVVLVIWIIDPAQLPRSVSFALISLWQVSGYLLLSSAFIGFLAATGSDQLVKRAFSGHPMRAILVASTVGSVLPLCSASVVPIILALLAAGAPMAPIMAFWIASPLMDPETFIVTIGILGLPWAIARLVTAIALGVLAGLATMALPARWLGDPVSRNAAGLAGCGPWAISRCGSSDLRWFFWKDRSRIRVFWQQASTLLLFLVKWLLLAFLLESLLMAYVPADAVLQAVGSDRWWAIPASAIVGIPTYLNGFSALPLIDGLLEKGMMPGAAMAFLIAGEITSLPTAIAVYAIVRKGVFAWYVALGVGGSILAGIMVTLVAPIAPL